MSATETKPQPEFSLKLLSTHLVSNSKLIQQVLKNEYMSLTENPLAATLSTHTSRSQRYVNCMKNVSKSTDPNSPERVLENTFGFECPLELVALRTSLARPFVNHQPDWTQEKKQQFLANNFEYTDCILTNTTSQFHQGEWKQKNPPKLDISMCDELEKKSDFGISFKKMGEAVLFTRQMVFDQWNKPNYAPCKHLIEKFKSDQNEDPQDELADCLVRHSEYTREPFQELEACWNRTHKFEQCEPEIMKFYHANSQAKRERTKKLTEFL